LPGRVMPEAALQPEEDVVKEASEQIADGVAVDWNALFARARTAEEREQLDGLRLLEDIARLASDGGADDDTALDDENPGDEEPAVQPDGSFGSWGKYRLRERVGEGSFGSVYRAIDPQLDLEVAIKILHERVDDPRTREALLAEGRMLAKVKHPNVVSVFGMEFEGTQAGLCTEFVRGDTLEAMLGARGPMPPRQAVSIAQDLCGALAAVHAAGLVHRDVKARNVMQEQSGRIVLMDFGTGRTARQLAAGRIGNSGTPLYMAPEVLVADQSASESSDVYSLGVVLYHLVTSRYPVEAGTVDELKAAHRDRRYRPVTDYQPDLPFAFVRVVQRAIAPDAASRYADAGAFLAALRRVFPNERPIKAVARRLLLSLAAAAMTAGVLIGLGAMSSRAFNLALERSAFATDRLSDWLTVGVRSSVLLVIFLIFALVPAGLCLIARRLLIGVSATARRWDERARDGLRAAARRLRLDDASALASWILLLSIGAFVSAYIHFSPLLDATVSTISTAPAELLAALSPAAQSYQESYRYTFVLLALATAAAWLAAIRLAYRRGQTMNRGLLGAGIGTLVLILGTSVLPYRLVHKDAEFRAAAWRGSRCYIIGERADEVLLFCPGQPPPRTQVLPKNVEGLERLETSENIFTGFSAAAAASSSIH
jgi:hypothetical protein